MSITNNSLNEITGVQAGQPVLKIEDKWVIVGGISQTKTIVNSNSSTIYFTPNTIFKYTVSENDVITINTSSMKPYQCSTMELWLTMPSTVVSFSIPNVTWIEEPSFDSANTLYTIAIRWDGEKLLANIAYTLEVV